MVKECSCSPDEYENKRFFSPKKTEPPAPAPRPPGLRYNANIDAVQESGWGQNNNWPQIGNYTEYDIYTNNYDNQWPTGPNYINDGGEQVYLGANNKYNTSNTYLSENGFARAGNECRSANNISMIEHSVPKPIFAGQLKGAHSNKFPNNCVQSTNIEKSSSSFGNDGFLDDESSSLESYRPIPRAAINIHCTLTAI